MIIHYLQEMWKSDFITQNIMEKKQAMRVIHRLPMDYSKWIPTWNGGHSRICASLASLCTFPFTFFLVSFTEA